MHLQVAPRSVAQYSDGDVVSLWLNGKDDDTKTAYTRDLLQFVDFCPKPLRQVTAFDLVGYAGTIGELAPSSVARKLNSLRSLLSYAHKRLGYLETNEGAALTIPRTLSHRAQRILSEDEVESILLAAQTPFEQALIYTLYYSGMRIGEAADITWSQVTFTDAGVQLTIHGKGTKTRQVPCGPLLAEVLAEYQHGAPGHAPLFGRCVRGTWKSFSVRHLYRVVVAICKRVGLDKAVSPHWLRHAYASHAIENGCSVTLLQRCLGHDDLRTTMIYLDAKPNDGAGLYLREFKKPERVWELKQAA